MASVFIHSRQRRVLKGETTALFMLNDASPLFRGICISATLYAALFLSHIVAAAQEWDAAFKVIAASITLMTFVIGPTLIAFGRMTETQEKTSANTIGLLISLTLAIGLAWAYADQSFDITLISVFLSISVGVHLFHRQLLNQKQTEKMG